MCERLLRLTRFAAVDVHVVWITTRLCVVKLVVLGSQESWGLGCNMAQALGVHWVNVVRCILLLIMHHTLFMVICMQMANC